MMTEHDFNSWDSPDFDKNYQSLKNKLEDAFRRTHRCSDLREAKTILIQVQSEFKNFRLRGPEREELYGRLQEEFQVVNHKIEQEKSHFEQEAYYNYTELKIKVEEAIYQAEKCEDWREAKKYLIEAQQSFRGLRLVREQREELYNKLQLAFDHVNARQSSDQLNFQHEALINIQKLKPMVEDALREAATSSNFQDTRDKLIRVQNEFRGIRIEKESREQLYQKLQEAFDILNKRVEEERAKVHTLADQNYEYFSEQVMLVKKEAATTSSFKEVRDKIRELQAQLRDSLLHREQKDQLYQELQESFTLINHRQDQEREVYESESQANYRRLGKMVADGLQQAQESNEFRETREFLKKIQGEFKGIRMQRDQREELYSRLQSAFMILRERTDQYFREKQKNWEVRMEFHLKDLSVNILDLQMEIAKEREKLEELETQLDILDQKPGESPARLMVIAQIQSLEVSIRKNEAAIEGIQREIESLQDRLGEKPEDQEVAE